MLELKKNKVKKVGVVVSDKMQKTRVVKVERVVLHPVFKKFYKRQTKFYAHDESNQSKLGDTVEIQESRPLSKTKRWVVRKVVQQAVI